MSAERKRAHLLFHSVRKKVAQKREWVDNYIRYLDLLGLKRVWKRQRINLINLIKTIYRIRGPEEGCLASRLAEARQMVDMRLRGYLFYYTNRYLRYASPCLERRFMRWKEPLYAYELLDETVQGKRSPYTWFFFVEQFGDDEVARMVRTVFYRYVLPLPTGYYLVDRRLNRPAVQRLIRLLIKHRPTLLVDKRISQLLPIFEERA